MRVKNRPRLDDSHLFQYRDEGCWFHGQDSFKVAVIFAGGFRTIGLPVQELTVRTVLCGERDVLLVNRKFGFAVARCNEIISPLLSRSSVKVLLHGRWRVRPRRHAWPSRIRRAPQLVFCSIRGVWHRVTSRRKPSPGLLLKMFDSVKDGLLDRVAIAGVEKRHIRNRVVALAV